MIEITKEELIYDVKKYTYEQIRKIGGLWKVFIEYNVIVAVPQDSSGNPTSGDLIQLGAGQVLYNTRDWSSYMFTKYKGVITLKNKEE